jgi:hypothetical protein
LTKSTVTIHELIAWNLDEYSYRNSGTDLTREELSDKIEHAKRTLVERAEHGPCSAILHVETARIQHLLDDHAQRTELQQEYAGLDWALGVVDLRCLLAFQRRLVFDLESLPLQIPPQKDWPALLSFSLGSARNTTYKMTALKRDGQLFELTLQSSNPDLQLRLLPDSELYESLPFSLFGGSPFFEVAELRGRWFLRDGYHRAYRLLQAGVNHLPAVVIHARTIDEVGATQPWFFNEEQLFSAHPPRVADFLEESLVLHYKRPQLMKTICIRIEESLQAFNGAEEAQGDEQ